MLSWFHLGSYTSELGFGLHILPTFINYAFEPLRDKTNNVAVRPAKTQISLSIRQVWSESSLCAQWVAKDPSFLHADSEDSDQTGRMPRLIWVFAGRTTTLFVLSLGGSFLWSLLHTTHFSSESFQWVYFGMTYVAFQDRQTISISWKLMSGHPMRQF